ncbi:MAG: PorT family protein [Bacteroidetes bacterium]|nr:PorT family protein [Bacteroidota bacterium]
MLRASGVVLLFCLKGYAQVPLRFDVGIKAGYNLASINSSSAASLNPNFFQGYHAGIYTMFKISNFAIQPEFVYSAQGQTFQYPITAAMPSLTTQINYLTFPIILKAYVAGGFNLQAGPQLGMLLSSQGSVQTLATGQPTVSTQSLNQYIKSNDAGAVFGLGWDLPLGLNLTARYYIGLANINYYSTGYPNTFVTTSLGTSRANNHVFQFSVGYRLFKWENDN